MNTEQKLKIGVVVAIEVDSVLQKYSKPTQTVTTHGYTVRTYVNDDFTMFVLDSGAGEISAATGTQVLISEFDVDMILNFGVVGALTERMSTAELCVVEKVIHYDFDTTGWMNLPRGQYPGMTSPYMLTDEALRAKAMAAHPSLMPVVCASADKFIANAADKMALHEAYQADICEMEAAGIVRTCNRNGVPCLLIKAVSDSLTGGGAEFMVELERVSGICFEVVDRVVRQMAAQ